MIPPPLRCCVQMSTKRARSVKSRHVVNALSSSGRLEPPPPVVALILFASPESFMGYHSVVGVNRAWLSAAQSLPVIHIDPPPACDRRLRPRETRTRSTTEAPYFIWETMMSALRKFPNARDVHLGLTYIPYHLESADARQSLVRLVSMTIVSSSDESLARFLRFAPRLQALRSGSPIQLSLHPVCAAVAAAGMEAVAIHGTRRLRDLATFNPNATDRRVIVVDGVAPTLCPACSCFSVGAPCGATGCAGLPLPMYLV